MVLRATPCIRLKTKQMFFDHYSLPDSAYGEWIFYQSGIPKFYYCAFNEDGTPIAMYIKQHNLNFETVLIGLIERKGFDNIVIPDSESIFMKFDKRSKLVNVKLLEIKAR